MRAAAPSTEAAALLGATQALLEDLYRVNAPHPAAAFLLTDATVADVLRAGTGATDETLLVEEDEDGLSLSLYLDAGLIGRLVDAPPHESLDEHNLADFWALLEGVSHFVYLTWNAERARSVTPMELELQAEVDKYAASVLLWQSQRGGAPRGLHRLLFDAAQVDDSLSDDLRERYRDANRYAARYCLSIEREYLEKRRAGVVEELRGFYREGRAGKLARIGH